MFFRLLDHSNSNRFARHNLSEDEDDNVWDQKVGGMFAKMRNDAYDSEESMTPSIFEKIMSFDEQSSTYMKEGKFHEAYGLLDCLHKHGHQIHFVHILVDYYVSLMWTNRRKKASEIKDELVALLTEKLDEFSSSFIDYAFSLLQKKKLMEALLFFQVAAHFIEIEKDVEAAMKGPQKCCYGMSLLTKAIIEDSSFQKTLVTDLVIPCMEKCKDSVAFAFTMNMKMSSMSQAVCLLHIASCYKELKIFKDSEKSYKEGITVVERSLKEEVAHFKLYGIMLSELAEVYEAHDKLEESLKAHKSALAAIKKAKDFERPLQKNYQIKKFEQAVVAAAIRVKQGKEL